MDAPEDETGHGKPLCGAKARSGMPCRRPAGWGTNHSGIGRCKNHGGSTPNHERSAQMELARRECAHLGYPVPVGEGDPGEILLGLVREAAGNVEFYRAQVQALPTAQEHDELCLGDDGKYHYKQADPAITGRTYHQSGIPTGEAKANVLVQLYNDERDRLAGLCQAALKAGVEERRMRLQEGEARELMAGIVLAIKAAKLTPEQSEVFRREFATFLRQLDHQPELTPR